MLANLLGSAFCSRARFRRPAAHLPHQVAQVLDRGLGPNRVPQVMHSILVKRLTFRGFIVWDFAAQYLDFLRDMSGWLVEGRVKYREDITDGLVNAPRELIGLLKGENFGKKIIKVSADPTQR